MSGRQHLVQHYYADGYLSLLRGEAVRSQLTSDQRLVATHRRFDQQAFAIICCFLLGQPSSLPDHLEMPVTLCESILFTTEYGGRAWWYHNFDIIAVRRDRRVGGGAIIRAVCRYPTDPVVNLIQQRRHLRRIVGVLISKGAGNYHAIAGIDRQMAFAPFPTRLHAVFRLQPLTRSVDLQPVLSINKCNGPCGTEAGWIAGNVTARRLIVL